MTISNSNSDGQNLERPALVGTLGPDYERSIFGGGSGASEFAPPEQVKRIFHRGLDELGNRLRVTNTAHQVEATMARVRLHPQAVAKSHRHPALFDVNRFQVAGVQHPGDILGII